MATLNTADITLAANTPSITLTTQLKNSEDQYQYCLDAKAKLSNESVPEGTIQKKSKQITLTADETLTAQVKNTTLKLGSDEAFIEIGSAKFDIKDGEISICVGSSKLTISDSSITIKAENIEQDGQSISMKGDSISGKAPQVNLGP
ncbi:hypothetical protein [Cysteiniphilum sp. QT6929]|uniref:hypothetical protein n=1 Tax=Cysteiniphilum sp. QT6929 TaxID=2975055 RepID=UPI0024B34CE2|nr:hypothetical protein [Cysteiniphilum sp. QT6929]WHN66572.1 hypothetical protein NYP54_04905 [Cysteiniphilum sp. QT6929]